MVSQKNFLLFILATILVLGVGMFLPAIVAIAISVIYFAAVTWFKPKLILPLLLLYFPVRPFVLQINDGLKYAGDVAILTLVAVVMVRSVKQKDYRSIFRLEWYEWAFLGFCLVGAVASLTTGVQLIAIVFQLRKFLMLYLFFYGVKRLHWEREEVLQILKLLVGVALLLVVHGFIEKLSQRKWLVPQSWQEQFISPANFERIYGLLGNPNSMGLFMILAIMASFTLLRLTRKRVWYLPLVLSFGTLLLTYSRGSIIGVIVAGILYLILARNIKLLKQVVIAGVAGFVLVFLPVDFGDQMIAKTFKDDPAQQHQQQQQGQENGSLGDRFSSSFDEEQLSRSVNTGRIYFVKRGLEIWTDYPVIGTGFGTFGDSAALVYSSPIYEDYGLKDIYDYMGKDFYSDNQYIQIIVQTGTVGTILFAVFMLNMLYRIWMTRKKDFQLANAAIFLWLFIAMVGVVYNVWENQVFPLLFLALIAWLETVKHNTGESLLPKDERKEQV